MLFFLQKKMSKIDLFYNLRFSLRVGQLCRRQKISVGVQNGLKKAVFRLLGKWRKNALTLAPYWTKKIWAI